MDLLGNNVGNNALAIENQLALDAQAIAHLQCFDLL
jgi:hypothetical protein